ncbi:hypothetical protein F4860DRAFT_487720 [Xylaria cubensis]|nr:hypothetical protein F4860DRAFT_487720 [Xylaria cubensis]
MKDKNPPDERVVYLALKNVFKGKNAEVRRLTAVRKLITQNQKDSDVSNLINGHNIDIVCQMARSLLTEEIFESTLKAKIRFPEVFDVSPAQSADRAASEAEAAINEANAIKGVVHAYSEDVQYDIPPPPSPLPPEAIPETESVETFRDPKLPTVKSGRVVPSLFPVYLPLRTQHRILTNVQSILEEVCFDYAERFMPEILKKNRWDCSEAAELNLWSAEFLQRQNEFSDRAEDVRKPLTSLLRSVADIRHTAVHRICISAKGLEQFLLNAESFAMLLGDEMRLKSLTELRRNIQQSIEELERNKHVLSSKLKETLKRIAAQRAELDRIEEMAISDMMREDGEYQAFAGRNLEEATISSQAPTVVTAVKEDETGSNIDDVDIVEEDSRSVENNIN